MAWGKILFASLLLSVFFHFQVLAEESQTVNPVEKLIQYLKQQLSLSDVQVAQLRNIGTSMSSPGPLPSSPQDLQAFIEKQKQQMKQMVDQISQTLTDSQRQQLQGLQP